MKGCPICDATKVQCSPNQKDEGHSAPDDQPEPKEFADATDSVVEQGSNYGPVGTTMALLEQSSKLFNAVHKRLHAAQSKDLRILARLDSEYLPDMYPYEVAGSAQQVFREDFNLKSIDFSEKSMNFLLK